jgi:hypothetical protein
MEPFIILPNSTYFGGKAGAGVTHTIINQIPKHERFVSGFLGHCAILRHKRPASENVGIELNPKVCEVWRLARWTGEPFPLEVLEGSFLTLPLEVTPETFVYLDPPYPLSTRKSAHRYEFELTDEQHADLLEKAKGLPCMVAISTYDNPLYSEALAGWRKIHFQAQTRGGKPAAETLYMNYPEPSPMELHDPRFSGSGYRQREKEKRRLLTIGRKIERLEETEAAKLVEMIGRRFPHLVGASPR